MNFAAYSVDGGSNILTYALEADDGTGYVEVVDSLVNTFTFTDIGGTAIASGATYSVRYRAKNVHGSAVSYSPVLVIYAATISSAPTDIGTDNSGDNSVSTFRVSWTAPASTGGASVDISAYKVLFRESDGSTFTESSSGSGCNPSDPTAIALIVTNGYCDIEMAILRVSPFSLVQADLIYAKVAA